MMTQAQNNVKNLRRHRIDADPAAGGFWPDVTPAATIHRVRDRLFVGGGGASTGNFSGTQGGFVPAATDGANWAARDSFLFAASDKGLIQITGFSSNANMDVAGGQPTETIGVAGFVIGNKASRSVWGLYSDVQFEAGSYAYGIEIAAKNKEGVNRTSTPYFATTGVYGIWLPGGGDASYGGAPTNPSNTAIAIGKNSTTWNRGIVFIADSITGTDGVTGTGTAIELAKGHVISWRAPGNFAGFSVRSDVSSSASDMALVAGNNLVSIFGTGGVNVCQFSHQTSAVNYWQMQNRAPGAPPLLTATGTDTDVDAAIQGKGAGGVRLRDGGSATKVQVNTTGVGFFGTAPVSKPTLAAASTDLATVITLANDIRTRLINYGLAA